MYARSIDTKKDDDGETGDEGEKESKVMWLSNASWKNVFLHIVELLLGFPSVWI